MLEYPIIVYEPKCWTVYVHVVPKEIRSSPDRDDYYDKYYVGITSIPVKTRWNKGYGYVKQGFYNAIQKYGWDNIQHKIIKSGITVQYASLLEISLIKSLDAFGKHGYNQNFGGIKGYYQQEDLTGLKFGNLYVDKKIRSERNKAGDLIAIYGCICKCGNHQNFTQHQLKYNYRVCCDECRILQIHKNKEERYHSKNIFVIEDNMLKIKVHDEIVICDIDYYDLLQKYTLMYDLKKEKISRIRCYSTFLYDPITNKSSGINLERLLFNGDYDYIIHKNGNNLDYRKSNLFFVDTKTFTFYHHLLNNKDNDTYLINTYNHKGVVKYYATYELINKIPDSNIKPGRFDNIEDAINDRNFILNIIAKNNEVINNVVSKYYKTKDGG